MMSSHFTPQPEIDHSKGFAFLHNGDVFYSPNCARQTVIPSKPVDIPYPYPARTTRIESFLQPRWFAYPYPYLPFVPLHPSFAGPIFGSLNDSSIVFNDEPNSHLLGSPCLSQWCELEDLLIRLAYHMRNESTLHNMPPFLKPIPPSLLGFAKIFQHAQTARTRARISRNWFGMWMALVAWLVAEADTSMINAADETWFAVLSRCGFAEWWLSALQTSEAARFTSCPRVGVILDCVSPDRRWQPKVEWYCAFNVPVWYPWTPTQAKLAQGDDSLKYLHPPPHLLQALGTVLHRAPSLPSSSFPENPADTTSDVDLPALHEKRAEDMSDKEYTERRDAVLASKPWNKFFEAREKRNEIRIANETPQAQQTRLNRMNKPPTVSAEVFKWDWSESNPFEFVRIRVSKRERVDFLESYSKAQCIYDPVTNVWDVCEEFGPDDSDSDSEQGYDEMFDPHEDLDKHFPILDLEEEEASHISFFDSQIAQMGVRKKGSFMLSPDMDEPEITVTNNWDIVQYLSLYYGYLPPIPLPATNVPVPKQEWEDCLLTFGCRPSLHPPVLAGAMVSVKAFAATVSATPMEGSDLWDLSPGHCRAFDRERLATYFFRFAGMYILTPPLHGKTLVERDSGFSIALTSSDNALYVFRLIHIESHSVSSLVAHLVEQGIRFLTICILDTEPYTTLSLDSVKVFTPQRTLNYVFTVSDYEIYVQQRAQLLHSPRGRAALLHGGIVSRIAREHLAPESACMGPSSAVIDFQLGVCFTTKDGTTYWDDKLTEEELDMICGMHLISTGRKDQYAKVSWWPSASLWDTITNGYNWHHWTDWDEEWYQQRCDFIRSGDKSKGVPLSQTKWREKLRGPGIWRKLVKSVTQSSDHIFNLQ